MYVKLGGLNATRVSTPPACQTLRHERDTFLGLALSLALVVVRPNPQLPVSEQPAHVLFPCRPKRGIPCSICSHNPCESVCECACIKCRWPLPLVPADLNELIL